MRRDVHLMFEPGKRAAWTGLLVLATLACHGALAQSLPPNQPQPPPTPVTPQQQPPEPDPVPPVPDNPPTPPRVNTPPPPDDRPTPQRDPQRDRHSSGDKLLPWALGAAAAAAFGALLAAPQEQRPGPAANDDYLALNGPRPAESYKVGTFVIEGYIRDGWPLVVDFLPQPDSCTALDVYIGHKRVFSRLLDADGLSGRRLVTIGLPGRISAQARAALYVVHSESPACARSGGAAEAGGVPVEVYGIGAGPRAVGSVAVDRLTFAPVQPKLPQELVQIGYRTQWQFNQVSVEILRFHIDANRINVERVRASRHSGPPPGKVAGQPWDGRNNAAQLSLGSHRLQVRAWLSGNDRSWVGAISPESVRIVNDASQ